MEQTTFQIILLVMGVGSTVVIAILFKYILKSAIEKVFEVNQFHAVEQLATHCSFAFTALEKIINTLPDLEVLQDEIKHFDGSIKYIRTIKNKTDLYVKEPDLEYFILTYVSIKSVIRDFILNSFYSQEIGYSFYQQEIDRKLFKLYTKFGKYLNPANLSKMEDLIIYHKLELTQDQYDAICDNYH